MAPRCGLAISARPGQARIANVRVIEGALDDERFQAEFLACDAVVLPYLVERYRARNSGVFTDAVASGIAVIVTGGTCMGQQLGQGSGAGLTFRDRNPGALADAIAELVGRRGEMRKRAARAATAWREAHDPVRFVRDLTALFG